MAGGPAAPDGGRREGPDGRARRSARRRRAGALIRALLVDAAGTLLFPAEPVAAVYARAAREHGIAIEAEVVRARFMEAFRRKRPAPRYEGDGGPFWRSLVAEVLESDDEALFDELYQAYAEPGAWRVARGALEAFDRARARGVRVAIVSDWDTRLRPLLNAMGVLDRVDALVVSCEVGAEKPDPAIFLAACTALGVSPRDAVHVGDEQDRDVAGARAAGCAAWRIGRDVPDLPAAVERLLDRGSRA